MAAQPVHCKEQITEIESIMSWNITQHPLYALEMEKLYDKRMGNLKIRTDELESLKHQKGVVTAFQRQAPFWLHHGKALDRVESFLQELCEKGRFDEHKGCMQVWAEAIHAEPMRFFENFDFRNQSAHRERTTNFSFSATDSFETLNGLLALDPVRCLKVPGLLSGNWLAGAMDPENRDLAVLGIFSGFTRYTKHQEKHARHDEHRIGVEQHGHNMFRDMARSMGDSWSEVIAMIPESPAKMSPHLQRYYSKLVGEMQFYDLPPLPLPRLFNYTDSPAPRELFTLALKTKLLGTPQHAKYLDRITSMKGPDRYSSPTEQNHYMRMIQNEYSDVKQIRNVIIPYSIDADHIEEMEKRGFAKEYINSLKLEEREHLIVKDAIPVRLLEKFTDKAIKFRVDLGV